MMEIRQSWKPIKLKAVDDQDLQVFSQFLYESIVLPTEIKFEEKKQRFAMAIERFTWEHAKDEGHLLMQVLSILVVNYVEKVDLSNIHWAIVGGESGSQARPIKEEWIDEIYEQCSKYEAAFFFKQWGTWGKDNQKRSKKANGREYRGRTWDEMPELNRISA